MEDTVELLSGAARFVGGLLIVFGAAWFFLNLNDQNRLKGPILMMAAGGMVESLTAVFAAEA